MYPQEEVRSINDMDEETFIHAISLASYASSALFEGLSLQGTNIIIQSGKDANNVHDRVCFQVIPRNADDGISFLWKPQSLSEEDMTQAKESISHHMFPVSKEPVKKTEKKQTPVKQSSKEKEEVQQEPEKTNKTLKEDNYLFKYSKKIP